MAGQLHEIPRKFDKILPKFDLDKLESLEDHVINLFLAMHLLGVEHDNVVCKLFPYTFSGKSSTWYFSLHVGSIAD